MDPFQKYKSKVLDTPYLAQLYNPEFKQVGNLYFLSDHMDDDSLQLWLKNPKYLQTPEKLENTINHVHLDELMEDEKSQQEIGKVLKQRWREKLAQEFPKQKFEIKVIQMKDGGWELQMWAKRAVNQRKSPKQKAG